MIVLSLVVATVAAFFLSFVYYSVMPAVPSATGGPRPADARPTPGRIALELLRSLIVAGLVAGLLGALDDDRLVAGVLLGLALWSLPVVLLAGSAQWENVPLRTAASHAGDWLVKLVAIGAIVGGMA